MSSIEMTASPARLAAVHKRYGAQLALDGLDLALEPGRVLALLGPNGAGKSTAVSLLLGLQQPDAGQACLCGRAPDQLAARRAVGVMLQQAALPDTLCVGELLAQVRGYYAAPLSVTDCVGMAGLDGLLRRRYGQLSGGQQRRVQFALAICGRPQVLFLDEPTTGLDIEARQQLWAAIRTLAAARRDGAVLEIHAEPAEAVVARLLHDDPQLCDLEIHRAGLADAFLAITREAA